MNRLAGLRYVCVMGIKKNHSHPELNYNPVKLLEMARIKPPVNVVQAVITFFLRRKGASPNEVDAPSVSDETDCFYSKRGKESPNEIWRNEGTVSFATNMNKKSFADFSTYSIISLVCALFSRITCAKNL